MAGIVQQIVAMVEGEFGSVCVRAALGYITFAGGMCV